MSCVRSFLFWYFFRKFGGSRLLVPSKKALFYISAVDIYVTYVLVCFPLRTVAFRGHGFSLLALAKGMSALFAKNGFSRPSLGYCGVFRHVLGLRTARPIENLCSRRSQRSSAPNNHRNSESKI